MFAATLRLSRNEAKTQKDCFEYYPSQWLQYFLNRSKRKSANPKSKGLWGESATNARCKGLQRALVADGRERTAVASRFRLALAASLRLRGFTQTVPPLRLRLAAANARPKRKGK